MIISTAPSPPHCASTHANMQGHDCLPQRLCPALPRTIGRTICQLSGQSCQTFKSPGTVVGFTPPTTDIIIARSSDMTMTSLTCVSLALAHHSEGYLLCGQLGGFAQPSCHSGGIKALQQETARCVSNRRQNGQMGVEQAAR